MSRQPNGGFIGKENITDNTTASGVYTLSDVARKVADNEYPPARFTPSRSLRFRQSASAYLSRTPASVGNRKTWTWSAWFKRGLLGGTQVLFEATDASGTTIRATNRFGSDAFIGGDSSSGLDYGTTQIFRDSSAWYHIIIAMDTTQAISSNRFKLYINGFQVTAFSSITYPTLNADTLYNSSSHFNYIGATRPAFAQYFDGYMSEINFVDGQALTPAAFGESDPRTGEWKPKRYAGTYGTNGFYLSFANNASTTTLGLDDGTGLAGSGAGSNDWTLNNFSLTAGTTYDSMVDVPGVGSAVINDTGGVVRGNYNTFNPVNFLSDASLNLTDGNLNFGPSGTGTYVQAGTTIAVSSGKFYFEYVPVRGNTDVGSGASAYPIWNLVPSSSNITSSSAAPADATRMNLGTLDGDGGTYMCAVDFDNGYVYRGRNGTWSNSATLSSIINGTGVGVVATFTPNKEYIFTVVHRDPGPGGGGGSRANANFGQRPFAYTPPTGFKTLNTTNLPEPTIKKPQDHFDVKLWTGNGSSQTIGNTARQRDNYEISRSLRFESNGNSYLSWTPSAAGNRKTWTWSGWVKRGSVSDSTFVSLGTTLGVNLRFSSGNLQSNILTVGSSTTTQRYTDTSKWYHIILALDTTQAINSNRLRLYVDGLESSYSANATISQNADLGANTSTIHALGVESRTGSPISDTYFDGYMAEINFVDGQALTPESFGVFDVDGSWQAKRYAGTYGTNGFYLDFNQTPSTQTVDVEYLVIGGGGGGAQYTGAGGGGAGGYRTQSAVKFSTNSKTAHNIIIGAGGAGGVSSTEASNGSKSLLGFIVSDGGGAGGGYNGTSFYNPKVGGSGGGGNYAGQPGVAGSAFPVLQGNRGGNGGGTDYGGGGGGAGAVGGDWNGGSVAGSGGAGLASSITGTSVTRAGGGGGAAYPSGTAGSGGAGGGGAGGVNTSGTLGTANTGGGGGASGSDNVFVAGRNGGSGVIIIRISNTHTATFSGGVTSSLSTSVSGFNIYTVTATSTTNETVTFNAV